MPDRPGALGAVASRIGAVRGDVVGIDILERGAGRAIDELVVELPEAELLDLLVQEMSQVDGVDVEDVRPVGDLLHDPRLDALETAARLVAAQTLDELLDELTERARRDFEADWVAVLDTETGAVAAALGSPPAGRWLAAFVAGGQSSVAVAAGEAGPEDVAWAPLGSPGLAVVLGRRGRPLRARERRQVSALARIAEVRWSELRPPNLHPSLRGAAPKA